MNDGWEVLTIQYRNERLPIESSRKYNNTKGIQLLYIYSDIDAGFGAFLKS